MADHPQIVPAELAEVLPLLALARGDDVQNIGMEQIVSGCQLFRLQGGGPFSSGQFAYAVKSAGTELWIQAAGGSSDSLDLTKVGFMAIEYQARACGLYKTVGFQTRRKGLVKKAQALGYEIDGYIMRKKINV